MTQIASTDKLGIKHLSGLTFAWVLLFLPIVFQNTYVSMDSSVVLSSFCFTFFAATTGATILAILRRGHSLSNGVLQCGGILFAVGNGITYLYMPLFVLPHAAALLGSSLEGISVVCVIAAWMRELGDASYESVARALARSMLLAMILLTAFVLVSKTTGLGGIWLILVTFSGIASSPFLWFRVDRFSSRVVEAAEHLRHPYVIPFFFEMVLLLVGFVFFSIQTVIAQGGSAAGNPLGLVFPLALFGITTGIFGVARKFGSPNSTQMKVALLMMVFGLLVFLIWEKAASILPGMLVSAGFYCFMPACLTALCSIARQSKTSYLYTVVNGFSFFFSGSALAYAFAATPLYEYLATVGIDAVVTPIQAIVLVLSLLLIGMGFFVLSEKKYGSPESIQTDSLRAAKNPIEESPNVERLTREGSLTLRQAEVLALLAEGMNAADIEASLCISNATARAHIRAIYEKLDVHSQAELMRKLYR